MLPNRTPSICSLGSDMDNCDSLSVSSMSNSENPVSTLPVFQVLASQCKAADESFGTPDEATDNLNDANTRKHPRFFFTDGSIQFTVESTEYSIHRSLLAMHAPDWLKELDSRQKPLKLENTCVSEVDALLSILYPSDVRRRDIIKVDDWASVLRLATRWGFSSFRALALDELEPIAPALDKLVLSHELNISEWLLSSYTSLCLRPAPLTLAEAERLQMADVVLVFTVRENLKSSKCLNTTEAVSKQIELLLTPIPMVEDASNILPSVGVPSTSQSNQSITQPAETVDISKSIADALSEHAYDRAVSFISDTNWEDASRAFVAWANKPAREDDTLLYDLLYAVIRRCARSSGFTTPAVRILSYFVDNIGDSPWDQRRDLLESYFDDVFRDILSFAHPGQNNCNPFSLLGKIIYDSTDFWLPDDEFIRRERNAVMFVGEMIRANVTTSECVISYFPESYTDPESPYTYMRILGRVLDSPNSSKKLDSLFRLWSRFAYNTRKADFRRWIDKLYKLRERNWDEKC